MDSFILQLATGTIIGLGAGYLGAFMVLRRMSLVGDALSHVALPGIAVALLFGFNPFIGAFAALAIAIVGIWSLERKTAIPSETLVGIFFTVSLALGLLLTPEPELLEALFGDITKIGIADTVLAMILVAIVIVIMQKIAKGVTISLISKDLARSMRIPVDLINLIFLFLVATVVALGLKVAGTLLMGSLVIIPAAAAKNIASNLNGYAMSAGIMGAMCAFIGIIAANRFDLLPGPIVILTSGLVFGMTLLLKKQ
ncbi:MAG: metal ABC transporter permease [Candidatus Yanofskybacteria bacterium]|nr:metal ABC transporter permease [Candidatus Yanofskybacteria bacterium]